MTPEGFYNAEIVSGEVKRDDKGNYRLVFDLAIEGGYSEQASHPLEGEFANIGCDILESLDLPYPEGLKRLDETVGKSVRCKVKHKAGKGDKGMVFVNCYIVAGGFGESVRADNDDLDILIRKLSMSKKTDDGNTPF